VISVNSSQLVLITSTQSEFQMWKTTGNQDYILEWIWYIKEQRQYKSL